jgi:WD40 repeat protein
MYPRHSCSLCPISLLLFISPGLDSKIIVWDVEGGPTKKIVFERANVGGIAAIKFLSPGKFASAGADCSVKIWVI